VFVSVGSSTTELNPESSSSLTHDSRSGDDDKLSLEQQAGETTDADLER